MKPDGTPRVLTMAIKDLDDEDRRTAMANWVLIGPEGQASYRRLLGGFRSQRLRLMLAKLAAVELVQIRWAPAIPLQRAGA